MTMLRSLAMAFAMFSRLPLPHQDWEKCNMRYLLAALPLVGAFSSLLLYGWLELCVWLDISPLLQAVGLTLLPLLFTGGIHMDGLADTADALASHGTAEKKRHILKDPHMGAFGAIAIGAYLIWMLAVYAEISPHTEVWFILLIPILSRAAAALMCLLAPKPTESGLLHTFKEAADTKAAIIIIAVFLLGTGTAAVLLHPLKGCFILIGLTLTVFITYRIARRNFGGVNGDVAGYSIQMSELWMLTALLLSQKVMAL